MSSKSFEFNNKDANAPRTYDTSLLVYCIMSPLYENLCIHHVQILYAWYLSSNALVESASRLADPARACFHGRCNWSTNGTQITPCDQCIKNSRHCVWRPSPKKSKRKSAKKTSGAGGGVGGAFQPRGPVMHSAPRYGVHTFSVRASYVYLKTHKNNGQ